MRLGSSLFLIAAGAILCFAVTATLVASTSRRSAWPSWPSG